MLVATVLSPEERDYAFECELCKISYGPDDYGVLLNAKKIAYFRLEQDGLPQFPIDGVPSTCICHGCLYNTLKELSNGQIFKIKLIYEEDEYVCAFDPDSDHRII